MKQRDLKEYRKIEKDIQMQEDKIKKLQDRKYKFGIDTVMSSSKSVPFTKRPITIIGYGEDYSNDHKKDKLIKDIREDLKRLNDKFYEIQTFINSIEDSTARQIIQHKYIDGLSWNSTARKIYGDPCGDTARMYLKRFFEKI